MCGTLNYVIMDAYNEEGEAWQEAEKGDNVLQGNKK